eukprot:9786307-Prorocentrum_lima.AAC.1
MVHGKKPLETISWEKAVEFLARMAQDKVEANVISYNAAISACEKGGAWQEAVGICGSMAFAKVEADVISCNAT